MLISQEIWIHIKKTNRPIHMNLVEFSTFFMQNNVISLLILLN